MKKFLEDLEAELKNNNLKDKEVKEILQDHEEMISEALEEGLTEEEIVNKFGDPKKLAKELADLNMHQETEVDFDEEGFKLYKTFELTQKELNVQVGLVSEDIQYIADDEKSIRVYYKGNPELNKYEVEYKDGTFSLKSPKNSSFNVFRRKGTETQIEFLLKLPKECLVQNMNHSGVHCDVSLNKINSKIMHFKTTNGDISINNCVTDSLHVETVNGDVELSNFITNSLRTSQINGNIEIKKSIVKEDFTSNTVSGDINLCEFECKNGVFRTVSGDIVGNESYFEAITLQSVSGDVTISNKDETRPIIVKAKHSVSGDIKINTK
ncbi:MAG: DUF4097 family beta strand repeat protein [Firmicutes bacterium]|nr:DUF4097 family beta strand repeat protein [Bacillota bacterium]